MRFLLLSLIAGAAIITSTTRACPYLNGEDMSAYEHHEDYHSAMSWGVQFTTRQDKLGAVLSQIDSSAYSSLPSYEGKGITSSPLELIRFGAESMDAAFDSVQDTPPDGRPKRIHPLGATAPVKFVPTKNPVGYTGMFQGGADACITRLSLAVNPEGQDGINFIPAMAIKCFRDGDSLPSANIITMNSTDGQGTNYNFFAKPFSNLLALPSAFKLKVLDKLVFSRASSCSNWISTQQFAEMDQKGYEVKNPIWPEKLILIPSSKVQLPEKNSGEDFRSQLTSIPSGTKLWDVQALRYESSTEAEKIGEIVMLGEFAASEYGDTQLFFKHSRGETDRNCGQQPISK